MLAYYLPINQLDHTELKGILILELTFSSSQMYADLVAYFKVSSNYVTHEVFTRNLLFLYSVQSHHLDVKTSDLQLIKGNCQITLCIVRSFVAELCRLLQAVK